MINKKLMMAALILLVGMPVMAEPAANPAQDPKAVAPVQVQGASHERKNKPVKGENKKVEKTAKATESAKAPEPRAGEAIPSTNENKKPN